VDPYFFVLLTKYYQSDEIKENVMGRVCAMYMGRREMHAVFQWGNLKEADHLEDLGIDEMIMLKWTLNK
jgi:hypothetical protein